MLRELTPEDLDLGKMIDIDEFVGMVVEGEIDDSDGYVFLVYDDEVDDTEKSPSNLVFYETISDDVTDVILFSR